MILAYILAQTQELMKAVTEAADKSDRWLFLFVLGVCGISASLAIRYLVNALAASQALHNEYVKTQMADSIRLSTQLNAALEDNTVALKRVQDQLDKQIGRSERS